MKNESALLFKMCRGLFFTFTLLGTILSSCIPATSPSEAKDEHHRWNQERLTGLKRPYSWTSVIGLHPLSQRSLWLGSGEENDIILPASAPAQIGKIIQLNDSIWMEIQHFEDLQLAGSDLRGTDKILLYPPGTNGGYMDYKNLRLFVIKRQEDFFLRVMDTSSVYRDLLTSIPTYDYDAQYAVEARFEAAEPGALVEFENVLGMHFSEPYAGTLSFQWNGKECRLKALDGGDDQFFVIFADETTAKETYGGGRYLYPSKSPSGDKVIVDFNRAINPPCVFTPFATCPLPPVENHLPIAVRAGEKNLKLY